MTEITKNGSDYIGYEYKNKVVLKKYASLYLDSYSCFGWEEDQNKTAIQKSIGKNKYAYLNFRRDRKIFNRVELTRLQRNFDGCVLEIIRLEKSKTTIAAFISLLIAIVGTAFMAGSVFAITNNTPLIFLSIILAIPGFCGWITPYFAYIAIVKRRTIQISPLIEDKYDEIYQICKKGKSLLT